MFCYASFRSASFADDEVASHSNMSHFVCERMCLRVFLEASSVTEENRGIMPQTELVKETGAASALQLQVAN